MAAGNRSVNAEQMVGGGTRERVDRLVVVAHDAQVVAVAEPPVEQRGLQRVHVLVLVDRERVEPFADRLGGVRVLVEHPNREPQHVLEVHLVAGLPAPLIAVVDAQHQIRGDGRLVARSLELRQVPLGRDHAVLCPFDLAGELASRQELVGRRQGVRERGDQRRLVVEHGRYGPPGVPFPEAVELRQGRRVERAGVDAVGAETGEPALELARGLLGERDRQDLRRGEGVGRDLIRDAVRDRGGLAGAGSGQDGDRSALRSGRLTLFLVQSLEDLLSVHTSDRTSDDRRLLADRLSGEPRYPDVDDAALHDRRAPRRRISGPHREGRAARQPPVEARTRRGAVPRDRGVRRGGSAGVGARDPGRTRPDPVGPGGDS